VLIHLFLVGPNIGCGSYRFLWQLDNILKTLFYLDTLVFLVPVEFFKVYVFSIDRKNRFL